MFKKIRIKLTLINSAVISIILITLGIAIFIESPGMIYRHGMSHGEHNSDYVYVRVDKSGNLMEASQRDSIAEKDLNALVRLVQSSRKDNGILRLNKDRSYVFLKLISDNEYGMTLAFIDTKKRAGLFTDFVIETITISILCILLIFLGSFYISNRALIPIKNTFQKLVDFTADASHELRTPLAAIRTNLEVIVGNQNEAVSSQKKWLNNIIGQEKRMEKLVDDLLLLSRADADQKAPDIQCFPIDKALEEAILPYEPVAQKHNIALSISLEPQVEFLGDQTLLKQLIVILTDNAIKYTNDGGKVDIQLRKKRNSVEITVSDNGVGIDKEHLNNIFDRFYRVDKARSRNKGGSGLGLAIAKWIVTEHHGEIKAESTPGKGTKFVVELPIRI